jgi:hypothetical protein
MYHPYVSRSPTTSYGTPRNVNGTTAAATSSVGSATSCCVSVDGIILEVQAPRHHGSNVNNDNNDDDDDDISSHISSVSLVSS